MCGDDAVPALPTIDELMAKSKQMRLTKENGRNAKKRAYKLKYYHNNGDHINQQKKMKYAQNPEPIRAATKAHKEKSKATAKARQAGNEVSHEVTSSSDKFDLSVEKAATTRTKTLGCMAQAKTSSPQCWNVPCLHYSCKAGTMQITRSFSWKMLPCFNSLLV